MYLYISIKCTCSDFYELCTELSSIETKLGNEMNIICLFYFSYFFLLFILSYLKLMCLVSLGWFPSISYLELDPYVISLSYSAHAGTLTLPSYPVVYAFFDIYFSPEIILFTLLLPFCFSGM